jgi:hypothetical protein
MKGHQRKGGRVREWRAENERMGAAWAIQPFGPCLFRLIGHLSAARIKSSLLIENGSIGAESRLLQCSTRYPLPIHQAGA